MADEGEERETTKWEKAVEILQLAFRDKVIVDEVAWQEVVLIPKGDGTKAAYASWR